MSAMGSAGALSGFWPAPAVAAWPLGTWVVPLEFVAST